MEARLKPTTHPSGEPRGKQALDALVELARDSVQSPAPSRLEQGARTLSAHIAAGQ